jgi:hypothetical protein
VVLEAPDVRQEDGALAVAFTLPKGSYATVVLRELTKVDVDAPLEPAAGTADVDGADEDSEDDDAA